MSMISAQIDELREIADDIESRYGYPTAVKALRDAADTIWQLRDDLQRANAAVHDAEHDESMAWDRVRKADSKNAKLRELAKKLVIFAFARCADCDLLDASCTLVPTQKCLLWNECESAVRELGIEVPDAGDA